MNDMSRVIIPKSDQLNADDLIAGARTVTITEVSIRPGTEQPVSIFFDGDDGKPYKPCKSMSRVLVSAWGPDANVYVGRTMTLYRDPKVKWGGMEIGGIRISHMSHIERDLSMTLTATKGKWAPYKVRPLATEQPKTTSQPQGEAKRPTWNEVMPKIEAELKACETEDAIQAIVARPMIQSALAKHDTPIAARLNEIIKAALDRFSEPVTDDDALWSDDSSAAA